MGSLFRSKQINPVVIDPTIDSAKPYRDEMLGASRDVTNQARGLATSGGVRSPLEENAMQAVARILSGSTAGESGTAFQKLVESLQPVFSLEDQRAGDAMEQARVASGYGAGGSAVEDRRRDQSERDTRRRGELSGLAFRSLGNELDRQERGIGLATAATNAPFERGLRGVEAMGNTLRTGSGVFGQAGQGQVSQTGYAPSPFEQVAGFAGSAMGAFGGGGLGGGRKKKRVPPLSSIPGMGG